jgi:hypothetical protein
MDNNFMRGLVSGSVWRCRMVNGAVFELWTPYLWTRKQARKELLALAEYYASSEVEGLWESKK